jgi:hypothetical protein
MSDAKGLLERIAALRGRLEQRPHRAEAGPAPARRRLEEKVQRGSRHDQLLEAALAPHDTAEPLPVPPRLTARGARLLQRGKEVLEALKALADDPLLAADEEGPLATLHRGSAVLIEVLLRSVQAFPAPASTQLRLCEGLELLLEHVESQLETVAAALDQQRREEGRIDHLAELLRRIATGQPTDVEALGSVAERVLAEAQAGAPLRFHYAAPVDPSRFAAAHGLTTAGVLARVLQGDAQWQGQLRLALMAALVHDVGMLRLPADVLSQAGPLSAEQKRLVERHPIVGGGMVKVLWPGGGWPVEVVTDHHERSDGTGYPAAQKEMGLSPLVRLVALCDVYAALGAPRPHRPAVDSRNLLTDLLLQAEHGRFDRAQAERLLELSFYPAGAVVQLDDGSAGVVVAAPGAARGGANPTRPVVQLLTGPAGSTLALPALVDLARQQDRHISRNLTAAERRRLLRGRFPRLL